MNLRGRRMVVLALVVAAPVTAGATMTIIQKNKAFSVRQVSVKIGDPVTFVNHDSVTHNVYSETKGLEFEIELQAPGQSTTIRFLEPGVAEIECAIHPHMKLQVRVRP